MSEATRRSQDNAAPGEGVHAVQQAAQTARAYQKETTDISRKVFDAWVAGAEATLRATFDEQNAALSAGLSVVDATTGSNQGAMRQWAETARQAQQAALDAFQANVRAAEQLANNPGPGSESTRR